MDQVQYNTKKVVDILIITGYHVPVVKIGTVSIEKKSHVMFAKTKEEKMFKETIYQRPEKSMRQGVNHLVGMVIIQAVFQLFRSNVATLMGISVR